MFPPVVAARFGAGRCCPVSHNGRDDATKRESTKISLGRFLGTIFWGGVESVENPQLQPLAGRKIPKNRKNTKKSVFFLERPPPVFLPDGPQKSLFLLSVRFLERGQGRL